jgi:GT2 family glycosyltransferase
VRRASNELLIINDPEVIHITPCINQLRGLFPSKRFIVAGTMRFGLDWHNDLDKFNIINKSMAPFIAGVMKSEIMAVGGWDERFIYWGNDDNDLMYRLGMNGCNHVCDETMIAYHQSHDRPPKEAMGDCNEGLLYEKDKKIVANQGVNWGNL